MDKVELSREEELKRDILDIVTFCAKCRFCIATCPLLQITDGWHSQAAVGITFGLYNAVKNGLDTVDKEALRDVLYSCTTCRRCVQACADTSVGVNLIEAIDKGRQLLVEDMIGPMPQQKKPLEFLERYKNPYGMLPSDRKAWMKGLGVPAFSKDTEVLFYIGCTAAHDARVAKVAKAVIQLLGKAGIKFGIIEDEVCCGCPSERMGEQLLSEELTQENIDQFKSMGVKRIVALSPHCYDAFINKYPKAEMEGIKIQHYTQLLKELIDQGKLKPTKKVVRKVAYQDPCYLGRHNKIYEEPRDILKSVPGVELVEFKKNRKEGLCCGGGGGRMWSDFEAETERLGNIRAREALEVGADTIVTACPFCLTNMEDGVKSVAEDKLKVEDIAEIVLASV